MRRTICVPLFNSNYIVVCPYYAMQPIPDSYLKPWYFHKLNLSVPPYFAAISGREEISIFRILYQVNI